LTVVGAELGLSVQHDARTGEALLVPSWLFALDGVSDTLPQVAVDPEYLQPPSGGDQPTQVPATPGSGEPGSPGVEVPPTPGLPPDPASTRFTKVTLDGPRTVTVTFFGGAKACFRYDLRADESAERVVLSLEETVSPTARCVEIAEEHTESVTLDAPLGDRALVDAESGTEIRVPR
jgi:hypothetical protein